MSVPIDVEILRLLVLKIPGAKFMACKSAADYSPHIEPGQKYIDYITEPDNKNFAFMCDGRILYMGERDAFAKAISGKIDLAAIFSVPRQSRCYAALERKAGVLVSNS